MDSSSSINTGLCATALEGAIRSALFLAAFESNALTGQSLVVSHGWFMQ